MTKVIVIDLVGDEAVKAERKVEAGLTGKALSGSLQRLPWGLWTHPLGETPGPLDAMPAAYRALLDAYYRK